MPVVRAELERGVVELVATVRVAQGVVGGERGAGRFLDRERHAGAGEILAVRLLGPGKHRRLQRDTAETRRRIRRRRLRHVGRVLVKLHAARGDERAAGNVEARRAMCRARRLDDHRGGERGCGRLGDDWRRRSDRDRGDGGRRGRRGTTGDQLAEQARRDRGEHGRVRCVAEWRVAHLATIRGDDPDLAVIDPHLGRGVACDREVLRRRGEIEHAVAGRRRHRLRDDFDAVRRALQRNGEIGAVGQHDDAVCRGHRAQPDEEQKRSHARFVVVRPTNVAENTNEIVCASCAYCARSRASAARCRACSSAPPHSACPRPRRAAPFPRPRRAARRSAASPRALRRVARSCGCRASV